MSLGHGASIVRNGLVFHYDMGNSQKSWRGAPTSNRIFTAPLALLTYAYATGPVQTTVSDATFTSRAVNRYTISTAVNVARAAIFPPGGSLALSTPYAFSCIWKYNGTNTSAPSLVIDASKGNPETSGGNTFSAFTQTNIALGNGWTYSKLEFTLATSPTLGAYLTYGISTGSDSTYINNTFDVYNEQFEQNLYATPFVAGTRSDIQALLDLTGTNTVTASSLTYNSNGNFAFSGVGGVGVDGNYISCGNGSAINFGTGNFTLSFISYRTADGYQSGSYVSKGNGTSIGFDFRDASFYIYGSTGLIASMIFNQTYNIWQHHVFVFDRMSSPYIKYYLNGVYTSSSDTNNSGNISATIDTSRNLDIGRSQAGGVNRYFNGNMPTVKLYNRALSATEVRQNFEALRGRYGI